ncbi:MAG TPA: DUF1501 domain-containing protein [Candidatus Methylacidiphilales bacterium]|jgi:uncharacterized protein (DUF1501 family)|nr:DUF1501 domain-containing protein [Candidatus Methylacidiphilales bacterium]
MNNPLFTTRREFLRTTLLGGALAWTVPSFVAQTFSALHAQADGALTQVATGKDGPILVLIQLAGGNDGLNAVVPYTNDFYYKARPTIAIPSKQVLTLSDTLGLNPAMTGFKDLFDAGHLSIVNGVGYPNPNRSHFRSTEIWQTASDEDKYLSDGWLGRYFDNACQGCDPTVAINIGPRMPQAFSSHSPTGITLENPDSYRFMGSGKNDDETLAYRSMYTPNPDDNVFGGGENSGASVSMVSGTVTLQNGQSALDFLERTSMDAQVSSDKIRAIAAKTARKSNYPGSALARNLQLVAGLIGGGLPTRVFYVSQGGYDTHTGQRGGQDARLRELSEAVKAFTDDLAAMGEFDRVMIMTFSEFGRRVHENGSQGTDHGAAAPMFLVGSQMKAGLLGAEPSLAPADLTDGDIKYNTDFRSVYASILQEWLKTNSVPILGKQFPTLPIIT